LAKFNKSPKELFTQSKPTSDEIYAEIKNQPPLLQEEYAQNFIGIKADWTGEYSHIIDTMDGKHDIYVTVQDNNVVFSVSLDKFPLFRTLKPNTAYIHIVGTIVSLNNVIEIGNLEKVEITHINQDIKD
jgi:hypothetical protein